MPVFHGKGGKVSNIPFAVSWALTIAADIAEASILDSDWKTSEVGQEAASATVEGNAVTERDTVAQLGAAFAPLNLYLDSTRYFSLTCLCTSITETVSKDDIGKLSYTFERNQSTDIIYNS